MGGNSCEWGAWVVNRDIVYEWGALNVNGAVVVNGGHFVNGGHRLRMRGVLGATGEWGPMVVNGGHWGCWGPWV